MRTAPGRGFLLRSVSLPSPIIVQIRKRDMAISLQLRAENDYQRLSTLDMTQAGQPCGHRTCSNHLIHPQGRILLAVNGSAGPTRSEGASSLHRLPRHKPVRGLPPCVHSSRQHSQGRGRRHVGAEPLPLAKCTAVPTQPISYPPECAPERTLLIVPFALPALSPTTTTQDASSNKLPYPLGSSLTIVHSPFLLTSQAIDILRHAHFNEHTMHYTATPCPPYPLTTHSPLLYLGNTHLQTYTKSGKAIAMEVECGVSSTSPTD
ncbi:hypothetical protein B0T14DRAFT_36006 [Immersiella caudata]|uniref:Uncharacterized protein n=1 Tax=Immersiella caudata TaxID=314043 RepID=A0AA40CBD9_9PEZI|nr:hypothetical protein B0T14DRAFT_36006 [Immersiella caudata]